MEKVCLHKWPTDANCLFIGSMREEHGWQVDLMSGLDALITIVDSSLEDIVTDVLSSDFPMLLLTHGEVRQSLTYMRFSVTAGRKKQWR